MKEYKIISATDITALQVAANMWIENGWQPLGGPIASGTFKQTFYQAMIKEPPKSIPIGPTEFKSKSKN